MWTAKLDNLKKWISFETYRWPKLSQKETDTLNRQSTKREIDSVQKKKKGTPCKSPGPREVIENSTQQTKNLYLPFSKYSKRLKMRKLCKIHAIKSPSPWYLNQTIHYKKRNVELYVCDMVQNPQQNISKPNSTIYEKDHTQETLEPFQGCKYSLTCRKSMSYTMRTKRKTKTMVISKDAEEALDKIQYSFMVKTLTKVGI